MLNNIPVLNYGGVQLVDSKELIVYADVPATSLPTGLLDYIDLFNLAAMLSQDSYINKLTNLLKILDLAKRIQPAGKNAAYIEMSVSKLIIANWNRTLPREFDIHNTFKENIERILVDCKLIDKKSDQKQQPDVWVSYVGNECPVEIKLKDFGAKALTQLEGYMEYYSSTVGMAVGRALTVTLPDNIIFVPIDTLTESEDPDESDDIEEED